MGTVLVAILVFRCTCPRFGNTNLSQFPYIEEAVEVRTLEGAPGTGRGSIAVEMLW